MLLFNGPLVTFVLKSTWNYTRVTLEPFFKVVYPVSSFSHYFGNSFDWSNRLIANSLSLVTR